MVVIDSNWQSDKLVAASLNEQAARNVCFPVLCLITVGVRWIRSLDITSAKSKNRNERVVTVTASARSTEPYHYSKISYI